MMRIVASSDWHHDVITMGRRRSVELEASAWLSVQKACVEKCDAYLFAGDLSNPETDRAHAAVAFAVRCALELDSAGVPSVWLLGNHDFITDNTTSVLQPLLELSFRVPRVHVVTTRKSIAVQTSCGILEVVCRPHEQQRGEDGPRVSEADRRIALGHMAVPGALLGSETYDMPRGRDDQFFDPPPDVELKLHGHYHRAQVVNDVHVIGSLMRLNVSEADNQPSFQIYTLGGSKPLVEHVYLPGAARWFVFDKPPPSEEDGDCEPDAWIEKVPPGSFVHLVGASMAIDADTLRRAGSVVRVVGGKAMPAKARPDVPRYEGLREAAIGEMKRFPDPPPGLEDIVETHLVGAKL